jgi:hypothetical protein
MTGKWTIPVPCYGALLAQASQHLWLVAFHDVYRAFTCVHQYHPSWSHLRLMLAETPFPHGSGASRVTVGPLSEGF